MRLLNKVSIVTGSSRGIGRGIALALAREGSHVVVTSTKEGGAKGTADEIKSLGRQALAIKLDVRMESDIDAMVRKTLERFGRIDILVNNAGVGHMAPVVDLTVEDWDYVMDINIKGVFLCSKYVARQMIKQGEGGKIINTASNAGKIGFPLLAHYCASKFAVIGFTQSLAKELAKHKIYVNAVCPGFIKTDQYQKWDIEWTSKHEKVPPEELEKRYIGMTPVGRIGTPDDVGKLVVFLASSESDFMTGQAINVTGGWTM